MATVVNEYRTVGKHTMVYGSGVVLGKLASFIMLPVYTNYLTTADYGVLELLGTTIDVIGMIAGIGLAAGVYKFYSDCADPADKRQVLSTVMIGTLGLAFLTALAGMVLAEPLSHLVFRGAGNAGYFRIFFAMYFLQAAGGPGLLLMRIQERSALFVGVNLAKLVLSLALNIYFVVVRRMGLEGVLLSGIIVAAVFGALQAAYAFRYNGFGFSWTRFRQLSRFGAPMILVSVGSFILTFSDRYFLNYFRGTGEVGIYSLAYKFSFLLSSIAVVPFQQIWEPRRFEVARRPDADEIFGRMFFYSSVLLLGGATVIAALIHDTLRVMAGPAFRSAYVVVPLILAVTVLQQWATYCNFGLLYRERTGQMAWASVAAVAVALGLNWLLIPGWGMMGAAWATLAAYAVRFALTYWFSQAAYPVSYPWARVGGLAAISLGVYLARALLPTGSLSVSVPYSIGLLLLAGLAAFFTLTAHERKFVRALLRRTLRDHALGEA